MKILKESAEWPKIAVYDIETTVWTNFRLLCHVDEYGNRHSFSSISQYVDWLFSDFQGRVVWAHAGGHFDHRFLIPEFDRRGWQFRSALSGGSIVLLTVIGNGRKIKFADSYRLMPDSLAKIGKTVGLEKIDVDRSHIELLSNDELSRYCFRDCDITLKGIQHMRDTLTGVNADFAFTLASIASRWVRRGPFIDFDRFYKPKDGTLEYDQNISTADRWCAPAYYGGRCEIFKKGTFKGPLYYYDIVSSYPTSMGESLPLYFVGYYPPPAKQTNSALRKYLSHHGITEAHVEIPKCRVGVLPLKQHGRLNFPYGIIRGGDLIHIDKNGKKTKKKIFYRWTNIELLAALERGAKITVVNQCRFEGKDFLRPFRDTFFDLRKRAIADKDPFRSYAYKILLNSLYGKTSETLDRRSYVTTKRDIERARESDLKNHTRSLRSTNVPGVYEIVTEEEGPFRHIAAGSYITALSRLRLLAGLEHAMAKGGEIYYCDTDSIITNVKLDEIAGNDLGFWKLEHIFTELEIVLPKVYRAVTDKGETIYRCKGVPIVREDDSPETPEQRWNAFKHYGESGNDPAMAALLEREGISGFVSDINSGTLHPRKRTLLRCLRGTDQKRQWFDSESEPLYVELVK